MSSPVRTCPDERASRRMRRLAVAFCLVVALPGCAMAEDLLAGEEDATSESPAGGSGSDPTAGGGASEGAPPVEAPAEPKSEPVVEGEPRLELDLPGIELTNPDAGDGPRPELAWEPIDAAELYAVTLFRDGDRAYWSWRGSETTVRVGYTDDLSIAGPQVEAGMTWTVMAFDTHGSLIAQSGERPIAP